MGFLRRLEAREAVTAAEESIAAAVAVVVVVVVVAVVVAESGGGALAPTTAAAAPFAPVPTINAAAASAVGIPTASMVVAYVLVLFLQVLPWGLLGWAWAWGASGAAHDFSSSPLNANHFSASALARLAPAPPALATIGKNFTHLLFRPGGPGVGRVEAAERATGGGRGHDTKRGWHVKPRKGVRGGPVRGSSGLEAV